MSIVPTDAPGRFPEIAPDEFVTDERTPIIGNLKDDNGHGKDAANTLVIHSINGVLSSGLIGSEILLASGAHLIIEDDGSFLYDPAGGFNALDAGETTFETFTYAGVLRTPEGYLYTRTATVCIEITGIAGSVAVSPKPADFVLGTDGHDTLLGTGDGDNIFALDGDDIVSPVGSANMIDGGEGHDTVVYTGNRADYRHIQQADGLAVEHSDGETDTLEDIERVQFDDGALIFFDDIDRAHLESVYRFYSAGCGRTADEDGLRYWIDRLNDLENADPAVNTERFLVDNFFASDEFRDLHGIGLDNAEYVDAMYQNALGRAADDTGRAFWIDALDHGLGRADLLLAFARSDELGQQIAPDIDDGVWVV